MWVFARSKPLTLKFCIATDSPPRPAISQAIEITILFLASKKLTGKSSVARDRGPWHAGINLAGPLGKQNAHPEKKLPRKGLIAANHPA
jgi:hypothetical protein